MFPAFQGLQQPWFDLQPLGKGVWREAGIFAGSGQLLTEPHQLWNRFLTWCKGREWGLWVVQDHGSSLLQYGQRRAHLQAVDHG
jgi:hypothetical protein